MVGLGLVVVVVYGFGFVVLVCFVVCCFLFGFCYDGLVVCCFC